MSTEIKKIKGTCHLPLVTSLFDAHGEAELYLTRFYNGTDGGVNIQLTVTQEGEYGTSYIHLTKEQCEELGKVLLECFDYDKYPSE